MPYRTNIAYVYDGTFDGVLCCVYESYYQKEMPSIITSYDKEVLTLFPVKEIITNQTFAQKVENSIVISISREALKLVQLCFLSKIEDREIIILHFLRLGYKKGAKVIDMLADDIVSKITKAAHNVSGECHKYKGFLRFSEYNGALVAIIEPKNFVLPILAPHFCDRFPNEQFMIYDKAHKHIFIYQNGEKHLFPLENLELPEVEEEEEMYRALWKQFYKTIAIEGRYNPKVRMNLMPKRYWGQMTEFME